MSDDDQSSDASSSPPPETLIAGRARRTTAGNRLSVLLQHLDDADIQADLLADEEDDEKDYSAAEDDDGDVALESSDESDEETKPGGDDEDLAGEKELRKQERVESQKKRKARELVRVQPMKKKVKIADQVTSEDGQPIVTAPVRPQRPMLGETGPTRQSSRSQTIASAKLTEEKIKESRKRAKKTQEIMRIAAEKKAAEARPKLTQADRMARALGIEKENSKSLNRWEKSEQERLRIQQEKLEAMRNRKIEGPIVRYWSGPVTWYWREGPDGPVYRRCRYDRDLKAKVEEMEDATGNTTHKNKAEARRASLHSTSQVVEPSSRQDTEKQETPAVTSLPPPPLENSDLQPKSEDVEMTDATVKVEIPPAAELEPPGPSGVPAHATEAKTNEGEASFLDGIHLYAAGETPEAPPDPVTAEAPVATEQATDHASLMDGYIQVTPPESDFPLPSMPPYHHIPNLPDHTDPTISSLPLLSERASRTLLILDQFPDLSTSPPQTLKRNTTTGAKDPSATDPAITRLLLPDTQPTFTAEEKRYLYSKPRRTTQTSASTLPLPPQRATCAISGKAARFRDPKTRLPYADVAASKAIQRVLANGCQWSALLGVWAGIVGEGSLGRVARGVPEGFWRGKVKEKEVEVIDVD